jgi:hypothetical protein
MTTRYLSAVLVTLLLVGSFGALRSAVAHADYTVTLCQNGVDPPLISSIPGAGSFNQIEYECAGSQGRIALDGEATNNGIGTPGGVLPANTISEVALSTPEGTDVTISDAALTLVAQPYGRGPQSVIQVEDGEGIIFSHQLSAADTNWTYAIDQAMSANDRTIVIRDQCPEPPPSKPTEPCAFHTPKSVLAITALSLTLHDDEQPTLYLTGGELLLAGAHSGTDLVSFSASAPNSGVAEVDAYLGSTLVGSDAYESTQCSFAQFDPCPPTVSDSVAIDTAKVPDGSYPLVLDARDASGNTAGVPWSVPISVDNNASPATAAKGTGAVTNPPGPGAPNGRSATSKAQIAYLGDDGGKLKVAEGHAVNVRGRLANQTDTAIPGATVDVLSQTAGSNDPFEVIGHASTDANGAFTFRVPAGPSRVIRTGYRAFANDTGYDATADLSETVTAATSLTVSPKRLRGRSFMFQGLVHASSFPRGQQVEIQALTGSSWTHVTFASVAANGRFKVRYRLKHYYPHVTFVFRAVPVASPIWPYEPQPSNLARLHLQ